MKDAEMKVVGFDPSDVIATSGGVQDSVWNEFRYLVLHDYQDSYTPYYYLVETLDNANKIFTYMDKTGANGTLNDKDAEIKGVKFANVPDSEAQYVYLGSKNTLLTSLTEDYDNSYDGVYYLSIINGMIHSTKQ